MFFRLKRSGPAQYLQIVENRWESGRVVQTVRASLGRVDGPVHTDPRLTGLLASALRLTGSVPTHTAAPTPSPDWSSTTRDFRLERYLPYRLERLSQQIGRGSTRFYRQHRIVVQDWRVLVVLKSYGEITASDVVRHGTLPKAGVSRAVARLTGRGLVLARRDDVDARRTWLSLSEDGQAVVDRFLPYNVARQSSLLSVLNTEEQALLADMLSRLEFAAQTMADRTDGLGADMGCT